MLSATCVMLLLGPRRRIIHRVDVERVSWYSARTVVQAPCQISFGLVSSRARARAMAVFMLVYMGTWTAGSAFWGYVAGRQGTHFSLISAAIGTAVCPILVLISRLPDTPVDLGAWDHWGKPMLVGDVDPSQGPVLVTVEYEVDPTKADEFLEALHKFARVRRRDGASRWGVYRDTEHPAHYVETFIVESWAEHLRQHERLTIGDRDLEENVGRFESKPIKVRHFIYARSKRGRH
jgi:quinol monooxygenase YgiN